MRFRWPAVVAMAVALVAGSVAAALFVVAPSADATDQDPVIIVAGTTSPSIFNEPLRARLTGSGYDAFIFELPGGGLGPIEGTAADLDAFVDEILAETGADQVDLVGHSQGGLVARHYVKQLGGSATVDSLITLGAPNHGTALVNINEALGIESDCESCRQMAIGSEFLADLNAGDVTIGSVSYTNIYTGNDEIVVPAQTARLGDGAVNVKVQSRCPFRYVGHVGLIYDGAVYDGIRDALEHRAVRLNCFAV